MPGQTQPPTATATATAQPRAGVQTRPPTGRAHTGFCHQNINRCQTMTAADGTLFEHCTCGCNPGGQSINIMHSVVTGCVDEGLTLEECATRIANRPRGAPTALRTAALAMVTQGTLPAYPDNWTTTTP